MQTQQPKRQPTPGQIKAIKAMNKTRLEKMESGLITTNKKKFTLESTIKTGKSLLKQLNENPNIILLNQLLKIHGLSTKQRAYRLGEYKDDKVLTNFVELIKDELESRLVVAGLTKKYDPGFTQFLLKNRYGYRDKSEVDTRVGVFSLTSILNKTEELEKKESRANEPNPYID